MKKRETRLLRFLSALILLVSVFLSLTSCDIKTPPDVDYASNYFEEYNIPNFHKAKFRTAERLFRDYSPYEIPDVKTLAENTAKLYFENFHEKIKIF